MSEGILNCEGVVGVAKQGPPGNDPTVEGVDRFADNKEYVLYLIILDEKYIETLKDRDSQILEVLKEKMALSNQISQLRD